MNISLLLTHQLIEAKMKIPSTHMVFRDLLAREKADAMKLPDRSKGRTIVLGKDGKPKAPDKAPPHVKAKRRRTKDKVTGVKPR